MGITFLFPEGKSITNIVDVHNQLMNNNSLRDNLKLFSQITTNTSSFKYFLN